MLFKKMLAALSAIVLVYGYAFPAALGTVYADTLENAITADDISGQEAVSGENQLQPSDADDSDLSPYPAIGGIFFPEASFLGTGGIYMGDSESEDSDEGDSCYQEQEEDSGLYNIIYIDECYPDYKSSIVWPAGKSLTAEDLKDYMAYGCDASYDDQKYFTVNWNLSGLDINTPGYYTITGSPVFDGLGTDYSLESGLEDTVMKLGISIVSSEYVDFSAARQDLFSGYVKSEWIYRISNFADAVLQYHTGDGSWIDAVKEEVMEGMVSFTFSGSSDSVDSEENDDFYQSEPAFASLYDTGEENNMLFFPNVLENGTKYTFRLLYDGGMTSNEIIMDSSQVIEISGIGGDRDGGDTEGETMPDISQDTASSSASGSHKSSRSKESVTEDTTQISSDRLEVLLDQEIPLLISNGDAELELDPESLDQILINDDEMLQVTMTPDGDSGITVNVNYGGQKISDLKGSVLRVSGDYIKATAGNDVVIDSEGNELNAEYDEENEVISFPAESSGTYLIEGSDADRQNGLSDDSGKQGLSLPVAAGAGLAGTAGVGGAFALGKWWFMK